MLLLPLPSLKRAAREDPYADLSLSMPIIVVHVTNSPLLSSTEHPYADVFGSAADIVVQMVANSPSFRHLPGISTPSQCVGL